MEKNEKWLGMWDFVTRRLASDGILTEKDFEKGIEILPEWLYSPRLDRNTIMWTMRNLYGQKYPQNSYPLKNFKRDAKIYYMRTGRIPCLKVIAGNRAIIIGDEYINETRKYESKINSRKFIEELINVKREMKEFEICDLGMPKESAKACIDKFFDDKQMKIEQSVMPDILCEIALNFEEYYKWMQQEKQELEKLRADQEKAQNHNAIELLGGFIQPATDEYRTRSKGDGFGAERVSDIYSFAERDDMLRKLNPERVIRFNSTDEYGQIIKDAYTCYIYSRPQGNEGYLVISEPLEGNKATQAFYVDDEYVEKMKDGEDDENSFWEEFVKIYIEDMTRTEFAEEKNTYTFNHAGDLEAYRKKIESVIKGIEEKPETIEDKRVARNAQRASIRLYGKTAYKEYILRGRTREGINLAREAVEFSETIQTKEGDLRDEN